MRNWLSGALLAAAAASAGSASARAEEIPCGETKLVVVRDPKDPDHVAWLIRFLGKDGHETKKPQAFLGTFTSLCLQGRFLLVSDDPEYETGPSYLMRGDGVRLVTLDLGWGPRTATSKDHRIFWVQTHEGNGVESTRLRVFDIDGQQLLDKTYLKRGMIAEARFDGQTYRIPVEEPSLPG